MAIPRLGSIEETTCALFDLVRDEDRELDEEESSLAEREKATVLLEARLERDMDRARARHMEVFARIESLDGVVDEEKRALLSRLPGLAPPLSRKDRKRAVDARRKAIESRKAAVESRKRTASLISEGLFALSHALDESQEEIRRMLDGAHRRKAERVARDVALRGTEARRAMEADLSPTGARSVEARLGGYVQGQPERILPRARLDCEVGLGTDNNFYTGFAQNLSTGGLFVATFDLLPIGSELELCFSLPNGESVSTKAVVRWSRDANVLTPEVWPGLGLQFKELPPGAIEAIENFVREREPLFFPDA